MKRIAAVFYPEACRAEKARAELSAALTCDGSVVTRLEEGEGGFIWMGEAMPGPKVESSPEKGSFPLRESGVLFDGDIFNLPELDEGISSLYQREGEDCFLKINGPFSAIVYDRFQKKLMAAVDRFGQGFLYYCILGKKLLISNSAKVLFGFGIEKKISPEGINEYLSYRVVLPPKTIYEKVQKIPPGHLLAFDQNSHTLKRYWPKSDIPQRKNGSVEESVQQFSNLLTKSVGRRLHGEDSVGVLLSGGTDSSVISYILSKLSPKKINTFTLKMDQELYRDAGYSAKVAEWLKTNHQEILLRPDHLGNSDLLKSAVASLHEPVAMSFPNEFFLNPQAQKECALLFSGACAPALFYGTAYNWHESWKRAPRSVRFLVKKALFFLPRAEKDNASRGFRRLLRGIQARGEQFYESLEEAIERHPRLYQDPLKQKIFSKTMTEMLGGRLQCRRAYEIFQSLPFESCLNRSMYTDVYCNSASKLLAFHSLRAVLGTRVLFPYLDCQLAEFALSLPDGMKQHKKILRLAFKKHLPEFVFTRPEEGMAVPYEWFQGPLTNWAEEILLRRKSPVDGCFNPDGLRHLLERFSRRQWYYGAEIWAVIVLKLWSVENKVFL